MSALPTAPSLEASLGEQAQKHTVVASRLWGLREQLLSLLIDMKDGAPIDEVRDGRDALNKALEDVYKNAPRTNSTAHSAAQRALKADEELFFADSELDISFSALARDAPSRRAAWGRGAAGGPRWASTTPTPHPKFPYISRYIKERLPKNEKSPLPF